jgi:hypothetical protein
MPLSIDAPSHESCGSYSGYQRHRRRGQQPCEPCREASRVYMAGLRARRPDLRKREASESKARSRALWRLAHEHPARFLELVEEEKQREQPDLYATR